MSDKSLHEAKTALTYTSQSELQYRASTSGSDGVLKQFYSGYDVSFILPNEKEEYDGFVECLSLNDEPSYGSLQSRYGAFREYVVTVHASDGAFVGGMNMLILRAPASRDRRAPVLTVNLNYIFVLPDFRNQGFFSKMLSDLPSIACLLFSKTNALSSDDTEACRSPGGVLIFIEQNDPYKMSRADYQADTIQTGLDQIDRIGLWARKGAKIVDFAYVQPALTPEQEPDPSLVYAVIGCQEDALHAAQLFHHLEGFFGISVLKGQPLETSVDAVAQLQSLSTASKAGRLVSLMRPKDTTLWPRPGDGAPRFDSLRIALREQLL